MKSITIFTPTFNRYNYLINLYSSLTNQTSNDFVWLIIDDGSTDNTCDIVNSFINEKKIEIKYYYKNNGGKYTAMNYVRNLCETPYICCIDSDDVLEPFSIETMLYYLKNNAEYLGVVFPRNNKINLANNIPIDIMDLKFNFGIDCETTIATTSNLWRKYSFREYRDEKFASEEIIYNLYSKEGKFLFINKPIVKSEYLNDGLTNNLFKLWRNNINNSYLLFKSRFDFVKKYSLCKRIVLRSKCIINYISILYKNKLARKNKFPKINVFYYILLYPVGCYYAKKRMVH